MDGAGKRLSRYEVLSRARCFAQPSLFQWYRIAVSCSGAVHLSRGLRCVREGALFIFILSSLES